MKDQITLERIKTLHPKVREEVSKMYAHANENLLGKGVRLRFAYTYRSPEEQHQLYLQKPKVTNADSWQSIHQYGLAFDIVLLIDKDGDGNFESASWDMIKDFDKDGQSDWMEVTNYFKYLGWEWGGDWKGKLKDGPHFQKSFNLTWRQMKAKIDKGDYTTETVNGIKIKYISI